VGFGRILVGRPGGRVLALGRRWREGAQCRAGGEGELGVGGGRIAFTGFGGSSRLSGCDWTAYLPAPPTALRPSVNILARLSLPVVAVLLSGMSLGFSPVRADEFPTNTSTIESLTPEQAKRLVTEFKGAYYLNLVGPPTLDAGAAKALAEFKGGALVLNCLTTLDADTIKALAVFQGQHLYLDGLTTLDTDSAKALAEFKGRSLRLNGLATLDADTAKALAEFKGESLFVNGLTTLDADTAKVLAGFKGGALVLDGLTTLDTDTAKALAEFKGEVLFFNGLTTLDADTAKALAESKGHVLSLDGLTTLDADTAKALVSSKAWNGQLPTLTALDSPDSVAVAKALATREGPLSLPTLKKISPKTLTALIEKRDVKIPLIETLELIQEPDGSPNEDFLIPEGFKQ